MACLGYSAYVEQCIDGMLGVLSICRAYVTVCYSMRSATAIDAGQTVPMGASSGINMHAEVKCKQSSNLRSKR